MGDFPDTLLLLISNLICHDEKTYSVKFKSFEIYWDLFYGPAHG